ncbi:hypothetical protein NO1_1864 [Candidatus Termititenax aidoneus]|uniref:Uncharacterized protein n=1 Tax=Termititenax aidoneus TaxID=2218524 RepID=A0A388TDS9_TERA1|nr:hypothetical protein NO1_1864 [Candidatus Termititenax aidoneus]
MVLGKESASPLSAAQKREKLETELAEKRTDEEEEFANAEAAKQEFHENLAKVEEAARQDIIAIEQQAQAVKAVMDALEKTLLENPLLTNPDNAVVLDSPVISAEIQAITETINTIRAANTQNVADLSRIMQDVNAQTVKADSKPAGLSEASKTALDQIESRRAETAEKIQVVRQILAAIPDKDLDAVLDSVAVDLPREALKLLAALLAALKEIEKVAGINLEQAKAELEELLVFDTADKLSEADTIGWLFDEFNRKINEELTGGTLEIQRERIKAQREMLDMLTARGMKYTLDQNVWNKFVRDMITAADKLETSIAKIDKDYPLKDTVERQTKRLNELKEKLYGGKIAEVLQMTDLTDREKEVVKRALKQQLAGKPIEEMRRLAANAADPEIKAFIQQMTKDAEEKEIQRQEMLGLKPEPELITA